MLKKKVKYSYFNFLISSYRWKLWADRLDCWCYCFCCCPGGLFLFFCCVLLCETCQEEEGPPRRLLVMFVFLFFLFRIFTVSYLLFCNKWKTTVALVLEISCCHFAGWVSWCSLLRGGGTYLNVLLVTNNVSALMRLLVIFILFLFFSLK